MNEKDLLGMKLGETVADGNGNKYTKTIGGWIYQTFSGHVCFVPDVKESLATENTTNRKSRTVEK